MPIPSGWMYTGITSGCTTATTIEKLHLSFLTFGLPQVLVSDNGPTFSSTEFQHYMKQNGINHVKTVPHRSASNGLAKWAVKTYKSALKKLNTGSLQSEVNDFFIQVLKHSTHYHGYFPSPIADWTSVVSSVGLTPPKYCWQGTVQSKFTKADTWLPC